MIKMLLSYSTTKEFSPDQGIKVVAVKTGSVTIKYLAGLGGEVIATAGTISAGDLREITQGRFYLKVEVTGTTSYVVG